jgi:flagellar biosynthesis/type III secretory pathway protein FliH
MSLLEEQKNELDALRDTGLQLETAAATTAAAAAATAQRAAQHEAAAATAFGQTEELLKFQMMSMSLSYFSSLNMFKQVTLHSTSLHCLLFDSV